MQGSMIGARNEIDWSI